MARPTKQGLEYYPMDVGFLRDKKVRLLFTEFGAGSVVFVLYVLGKVYEENGYFLKWDDDDVLIAADAIHQSPPYIREVLAGCLKRSFFDEGVFQLFGVLTSAGIQRRYLRGCEKRDEIAVAEAYWLLNVEDKKDVTGATLAKLRFFPVSGGKRPIGSSENAKNARRNPERKEKETKAKQTKDSGQTPPVCVFDDFSDGNQALRDALADFEAMRLSSKAPLTERAKRMLCKELERLTSDAETQIGILNQSVLCGWKGVFPLKVQTQSRDAGRRQGDGSPNPAEVKKQMEWMDRFLEGQSL